jgi:hypothetical protein
LDKTLATTPLDTASSRRTRYFAGVSSSSRSGRIIGAVGSLVSCIELFFEVFEPGVAGPEPRGNGGSEFCRSLWERPKRSPKLFRPVDVDVRVDGRVGVGNGSSPGIFRKELNVEDLPRIPSLARVGEDVVDALDPCRRIGLPAMVEAVFARTLCDGDGKGEANP